MSKETDYESVKVKLKRRRRRRRCSYTCPISGRWPPQTNTRQSRYARLKHHVMSQVEAGQHEGAGVGDEVVSIVRL